MQREREVELDFRGLQIARAVASYWNNRSVGIHQMPSSLQDLLEDRRGPVPVHHLRRPYADPFTGKSDWILVPWDPTDPGGRFVGVRSRSSVIRLRGDDVSSTAPVAESDRIFAFDPSTGTVAARSASRTASASPPVPASAAWTAS